MCQNHLLKQWQIFCRLFKGMRCESVALLQSLTQSYKIILNKRSNECHRMGNDLIWMVDKLGDVCGGVRKFTSSMVRYIWCHDSFRKMIDGTTRYALRSVLFIRLHFTCGTWFDRGQWQIFSVFVNFLWFCCYNLHQSIPLLSAFVEFERFYHVKMHKNPFGIPWSEYNWVMKLINSNQIISSIAIKTSVASNDIGSWFLPMLVIKTGI